VTKLIHKFPKYSKTNEKAFTIAILPPLVKINPMASLAAGINDFDLTAVTT